MTVGAVNQAALARIIEVNRKADLLATVTARMTVDFHTFEVIEYRETRRHRAEKVVRKTVHVAHSFWLAYLGLCWGRWA